MATVVVEIDSEPSCSIPNPTSSSLSHRFLDNKFYLLVVIGELVTEEHLRQAIANIERGEAAARCRTAAGAAAPRGEPGRRGAWAATHIYRRPLAGCRELGEEQHKHELQNLFTYHFMRGLSSRLTARPSYSPSRPVAYERRGAAVRGYGVSPLRLTAAAPRCQPYKDPQSSQRAPFFNPRSACWRRARSVSLLLAIVGVEALGLRQEPDACQLRLLGDTDGWVWCSPHCGPYGSPERTKGTRAAAEKRVWVRAVFLFFPPQLPSKRFSFTVKSNRRNSGIFSSG